MKLWQVMIARVAIALLITQKPLNNRGVAPKPGPLPPIALAGFVLHCAGDRHCQRDALNNRGVALPTETLRGLSLVSYDRALAVSRLCRTFYNRGNALAAPEGYSPTQRH